MSPIRVKVGELPANDDAELSIAMMLMLITPPSVAVVQHIDIHKLANCAHHDFYDIILQIQSYPELLDDLVALHQLDMSTVHSDCFPLG